MYPPRHLGNTGPQEHFQLSNTLSAREVSLKTHPGKLAYLLLRAANAGLGCPAELKSILKSPVMPPTLTEPGSGSTWQGMLLAGMLGQ